MSDTSITIFVDRERAADVRPHMLELERVTGAGIGKLMARVIAGEYHAADLDETVRLGLMGAGTTPAEAAALAKTYVTDRPLAEGHNLATSILMAAWAGKPKAEPVDRLTAEAGEIILDATGRNPVRMEADGSLTQLNPNEPLPAWLAKVAGATEAAQ